MEKINECDPEALGQPARLDPSDPPGRCTDPDCPDRLPQEDDLSLIAHGSHGDTCGWSVGHLHLDPPDGLTPYTADERRQISEAFAAWQNGGPHAQVVLHAVGIEFRSMRWSLTQDGYYRPLDTTKASRPSGDHRHAVGA
jgi:hypothetical protein